MMPHAGATADDVLGQIPPAADVARGLGPDAFRQSVEGSHFSLWSWDIAAKRLTWSSESESVNGPPGEKRGGAVDFARQDIPNDRTGVFATMADCLRTHQLSRLEFRLPEHPDHGERWLEAATSVMLENGEPVLLMGVCQDISERLRTDREIHVRARQQEVLARLGERALAETDLQAFFDEVAATVADILSAEFVKILELLSGDAELVLRAGFGWGPGLVGTAHESTGRASQAGYALAAGRAVIVENLPSETRFHGSQLLIDHGVISGVSMPIAGSDGRAYGVIGAHTTKRRKFSDYDVSFLNAVANVLAGAIQRRQLDHRQGLMIRELRHRSGNLFSQILALFSQTAKNSRSIAELATKYGARVQALANAHRLVTEGGWKSASLTDLLNTLLAPYLSRVMFSGPHVLLEADATFGLSMALHELATNASQHGSLAGPDGRIDITWSVTRTEQGPTLILDWKETGGPPPKKSRRAGFGSRLINMVVERQLNGQVRQLFTAQGLDMRLVVPLTHERWPGAARQPSAFP